MLVLSCAILELFLFLHYSLFIALLLFISSTLITGSFCYKYPQQRLCFSTWECKNYRRQSCNFFKGKLC